MLLLLLVAHYPGTPAAAGCCCWPEAAGCGWRRWRQHSSGALAAGRATAAAASPPPPQTRPSRTPHLSQEGVGVLRVAAGRPELSGCDSRRCCRQPSRDQPAGRQAQRSQCSAQRHPRRCLALLRARAACCLAGGSQADWRVRGALQCGCETTGVLGALLKGQHSECDLCHTSSSHWAAAVLAARARVGNVTLVLAACGCCWLTTFNTNHKMSSLRCVHARAAQACRLQCIESSTPRQQDRGTQNLWEQDLAGGCTPLVHALMLRRPLVKTCVGDAAQPRRCDTHSARACDWLMHVNGNAFCTPPAAGR